MKRKSFLALLLAVFALTVFSCDTWMQNDDLYSDIAYDVKVANAQKINVFVRCAATAQGVTSPNGYTTFKVGIPQEVSVVTETGYGFIRWAAFSTNDYPAGAQHRTLLYVDDEDYDTNFSQTEIKSPVVTFADPYNPSTTVTVNASRNDVFIIPLVTARPEMGLSIPSNGEKDVARNMSIRISFSKPMDPLSFADAVSITEGSLTLVGGEVEISSKDISNLFEEPALSKSGKTLTLKFTPEGQKIGYNPKTTVNIIVSKQVKDIYGFSMVQDGSLSFTAGQTMDTWAPRITQLTGGKDLAFGKFQGMYKDPETQNMLKKKNLTRIIITSGSDTAANITNLSNSFYSDSQNGSQPFINNRVKDKVTLRVFAEDLTQTNDGHVENDVDMISIRSRTLFDINGGSISNPEWNYSSMAYIPQGYVTKDGVDNKKDYNALITAANENNVFGNNGNEVGCILIYDIIDEDYITSLPDGLVQIDVAAVDNVSNEGFYEDAETMKNQGNGWATLFIVKDTTPPVGINDSGIDLKLKAAGTANDQTVSWSNYYNKTDFESLKISLTSTVQNDIYDPGDSKLNSKKSDIKWTIIPIADDVTDDVAKELLSAPEVSWKALNDSFTDFTAPTQDNANGQKFAYGIKDDMDNINAIILGKTVKYDCTEPEIGELTWTADSGVVAGISTGTVLSNQLLEIPVTDETSKIKTIEILVKHVNANGEEEEAYASPFASTSDLKIYKNNTGTQFSASEYTINGKKLSLNSTYNDIEKILIKGIKIADAAVEGNYRVYVKAYDNAGNVSLSAPIDLSNDSTAPVIEKIVVPGLKKAVDYSNNNSVLYWTPSRSTSTDVYVYFTETNSGAKIFDFAGSTIKLTSTSQISIDNGAPLAETEYTKDTTNNKLTFKTPIKGTSKKLTITNAQINTSTSGSTLNLVITDLATKASDQAVTLQNDTGTLTGITAFYYENEDPVINSVTLTGNSDAESGYTKTKSITAELYVTARKSGVQIIKVSDNAKFDNTTTVKLGSTTIPATISADGTTLTLDADKVIRDSSYSFIITLTNVKLTSGDGDKKVTFNVKTLAERESTSMSSSIKLDTVKPKWKGKGLYSGATSTSYYYKIYPHPISNGKAYGVDFGEYNNVTGNDQARKILYFYDGGSYIKIFADVEDDNLKSDLFWKNENDSNVTAGVYQNASNGWKGHNKVYAMDKAGNKSDVIDYYYIKVSNLVTTDDSRKNIEKLEHDVELIVPADMDKTKNTFLNGVRSPQDWKTDYDFWGSSKTDSPLWAFVYVLKTTDGSYKLKIPVNEYVDVDKNSAPIEKYGVTHLYNHFPSAKAASYGTEGFEPKAPNWHEYPETLPAVNTTTQSVNDGDLNTCVDSEGNIIVTLPDHNCPPISLWLMDGCGNEKYILLNPGLKTKLGRDLTIDNDKYFSRNEAVSWEFDGRVGVDDTFAGTAYSPNLTDTTVTPNNTDTVFYKKVNNIAPYLQLKRFSDSCRFIPDTASYSSINGVKSGNADFENDPWNYSIRSRIILWKDSSAPTQADFNSPSLVEGETASAWSGYKEFYDEIGKGSSDFNLPDIAFPIYDPVDANGIHTTTSPYELWYIIEDRVGNCTITKLSKGSLSKWMYDVTPPTLEVTTANKVNYLEDTDTNYYSTNSTVKYTIIDKQSGIAKDGTNTSYSVSNPVDQLSDKDLSLENAIKDGDKLYVENVEDWAGNKAESKGLENQGSTKWVKQTRPTISTTPSATATINDGYTGSKTYNVWIDKQETDSETGGAIHKIQAGSRKTDIPVELKPITGDNVPLLGWIIRESKLTDAERDMFYDYSKQETKDLLYKNNGAIFTGREYHFTKDNGTQWPEKTWYFYAVNRAGLASDKPIIIQFLPNTQPKIEGQISYNNVGNYQPGTNGENFIKEGSTIEFTTNVEVSTCEINYGGTNKVINLPSKTAPYTYTVSLNQGITSLSGKTLTLRVGTAKNDSQDYALKGPAQNNKWSIDNEAPVISVEKVASETSTDAILYDGVQYIQTNKAIITLASEATDIVTWKMSTNGTDWTTINLPDKKYTTNNITALTTYHFKAVDKAGNESTEATVKVNKDDTAPQGNITYKIKKDSTEVTYPAELDQSYDGSDDKRDITFTTNNTAYCADKLEIDFTNITDGSGSGIKEYYYKNPGSETENKLTVTDKKASINLSDSFAAKVYEIYVKDNIGQSRLLKTFRLTCDNTQPVILLADDGAVNGVLISSTYYINNASAVIKFKTEASDIKKFFYSSNGTDWSDISVDENLSCSFTAPDTAATYYFKAIDKAGNESTPINVTLVKDVTPPALAEGTSISLSAKTEGGSARQTDLSDPNNLNLQIGDYTLSESDGKTYFTYNFNVKTLVFDLINIKETGSGLDKLYYKSASNATEYEMTGTGGNEISLQGSWSNKSYMVYAKDKAGNVSATLMTVVFTADSTGPVPSNSYAEADGDSGRTHLKGYTAKDADGNTVSINEVSDCLIWNPGLSNVYSTGTKILLPVTDAVQYSLAITGVNTYFTDEELAGLSHSWKTLNAQGEILLPKNELTEPHHYIGLFFKDAVGNVSGPYYLGNPDNKSHSWWIREIALNNSSQITVAPASDWDQNNKNYTLNVTLSEGTIVRSVAAENATISKVIMKYKKSDNTDQNKEFKNNFDKINYIYIPGQNNASTMEIQIKINDGITDSSAVTIKINGVEQGAFVELTPNPNIAASAFDGLSPAWIGAINTAGVMGTSSSSTISALSASIASGGLSTNVNTKLTPNAATKTPSVKKTKKAAEKALKKAAKETAAVAKTSANVVEEAPLVQEIASQIEDLGIKDAFVDSVVLEDLPLSEQIIKEDISPVTAKTDFVMSPIEKVEIADTIESAASSAEQAQPEKSSSKAALIVVMLAILSAAASLLVTLKKKRA